MILSYTRNKNASTIDLGDDSILSRANVEDTFFAATVEMVIRLPDLEITSVDATIKRSFSGECQKVTPLLEKIQGLRIGPGIIKAIEATVGGSDKCPRMADLVWECCNSVILRFTAPSLKERFLIEDPEKKKEAQRESIKENPRLIGSCIAFAPGSPLLEGIEIPEEEGR